MQKVHFSPHQIVVLGEFCQLPTRPEPDEYDKWMKRIGKEPTEPKPKVKEIPNTRLGFYRDNVRPENNFNAQTDLPEGWAIAPCWDSGNNHTIENAGQHVMRLMWNSWTPGKPYTGKTTLEY